VIANLSHHTQKVIDTTSLGTAGVTGAVAAITLNQIAIILTIISLLLNIGWMVLKYRYLSKHGADAFWGSNRDG
jgi:hypothetical protein